MDAAFSFSIHFFFNFFLFFEMQYFRLFNIHLPIYFILKTISCVQFHLLDKLKTTRFAWNESQSKLTQQL